MALHLVTGYKGEAHISAENIGAFNAGVVGTGQYVFATGNRFKAELMSNNAVKILDGDLIMQGRHISLPFGTSEELTISSGEIGKNRNDIIVARYEKDAETGIESASFAIVRGEPVSGTASDPELNSGDILSRNCLINDMPLYRIRISGLTASQPESLFKTVGSSAEGMTFRGWNPLTSKSEDTPEKWMELGSGYWMIDLDNQVIGQPSRWGILHNTVCAEEVSQKFVVQTSGETFRRNANGIGWYGTNWREGTWVSTFDESNFPTQIKDYWGNGDYGESKPNSVTFDFVPKLVVILGETAAIPNKIHAIAGMSQVVGEGTNTGLDLSWNGKTVSWYSSRDASCQMNQSGIHYFAFAIR